MIHKILYIGFRNEYGKKTNGPATNYKGWFESFVELGYDIQGVFFDDFSGPELQEEIVSRAGQFRPDMIFFILQKDQVALDTLKTLRQRQFFTIGFFGDDQWRFDGWTRYYAPCFSLCLTTDKFSVRKYHSVGQENVIYTQWASLSSEEPYTDTAYRFDVSFVGGANRYRKWFVSFLEKQGVSVTCFGDGWPNGRITFDEMGDVFRASKINLNISNSVSFDVRYIFSSARALASSIRSLIRKSAKNSSQTKARNFEIPVSGGFQLTDYVPTLEEYMVIGSEVACYNTIDEVPKLVQYFLGNEAERERVKNAGVERARAEHTFRARIVRFMDQIEKLRAATQ